MIDPRISLMTQTANVAPAINTFMNIREQQRQRELDPLRQQLMQQQLVQGEQALESGQLSQEILKGLIQTEQDARDLNSLAQYTVQNQGLMQETLQTGDSSKLLASLEQRKAMLKSQDRSTQQTDEAIQGLKAGDVQNVVGGLLQTPRLAKLLPTQTASQRDRQSLLNDLSSEDKDVVQSAKVALGIAPRASISAKERIATSPELTSQVAASEAEISGATEEAKLGAKVKLEPQLQAKIDNAKANIKEFADQRVKNKSNQSAYEVYQSGIDNLKTALGDTSTGPLSGMLPAWTASAQTAEGAISLMAPVLKQMFRSSGEGTFTDQDQKLLLGMIPTRSDNPEAIQAKLSALDNLVKAKLQVGNATEQSTQPQVIRFDAQGNIIQ